MLRPGQIVILARIRQLPARVRVLNYDPRGCWVGMQCGLPRSSGPGDIPPLRMFRGSEVRAAEVPEGLQLVLPGVLA